MALKIRLARAGRKKRPFYRIVVADVRAPRDGRYVEKVGTYNPLLAHEDENRIKLLEDRIKYWLGQGAKPSPRVAIFLGKAGIAPVPKISERPKKSAPGEKAKMRIQEREEKAQAAKQAAEEAANAPAEPAAEESKDGAGES